MFVMFINPDHLPAQMAKEGIVDLSEHIAEENQIAEEITRHYTPQPPKPDPAGQEKSKHNVLWMVGVCSILFLLVIGFTLVRKAEVMKVQDMTGRAVNGVVDERYAHNGFNFVKIDDIWYTELINKNRRITVPLHYGPREVVDVPLTGDLNERFTQAKLVYIAFNPLDHNLSYIAVANGELGLSLARAMELKLKAACTQNETLACAKQPILSCDTDKERAIIELRQADTPSVEYKGNCILITGRDWDLVKAVDRLLLKWYQIME